MLPFPRRCRLEVFRTEGQRLDEDELVRAVELLVVEAVGTCVVVEWGKSSLQKLAEAERPRQNISS